MFKKPLIFFLINIVAFASFFLKSPLCVIYRTQPCVCMSDLNEEFMQKQERVDRLNHFNDTVF
mgnify:CR=1 FL=1